MQMRVWVVLVQVLVVMLVVMMVTMPMTLTHASSAADHLDCDVCVANGYGWDWELEECGDYDNVDCTPPAGSTIKTSADESVLEVDDDRARGPRDFPWANTEATTYIWSVIHGGNYADLEALIDRDHDVVNYRAEDGRGALWWAYEYGKTDMVELLLERGADPTATDAHGLTPDRLAEKDL